MKRIWKEGYARVGLVAGFLMGMAALMCLCLPPFLKEAEAACNAPDGTRYELSIINVVVDPPSKIVCVNCPISFTAYAVSVPSGYDYHPANWTRSATPSTAQPGVFTNVAWDFHDTGNGNTCTAEVPVVYTVIQVTFGSFNHVCTNTNNPPHSTHDVQVSATSAASVDLEIARTSGAAGAAKFRGGGQTKTISVSGTGPVTVTIDGVEGSSDLNNMRLTAKVSGCICATKDFTVVDPLTLSAAEEEHGNNTASDSTAAEEPRTDTNRLFICQGEDEAREDDGADMSFSLTRTPEAWPIGDFKWRILKYNDGESTDWTAPNGAFDADPISSAWGKCENRDFKLQAWFNCDGGTSYNDTYVRRSLYPTIVNLATFKLKDAWCDTEVTDLTRPDESRTVANTLILCPNPTNGHKAEMDMNLTWVPSDTPTNRFRWKIRKLDDTTSDDWEDAVGTQISDGVFETQPTTIAWTTNHPTLDYEFMVRAWYDCDDDHQTSVYAMEPRRLLYASVIDMRDIQVKAQGDNGVWGSTLMMPPGNLTMQAQLAVKKPSSRVIKWTLDSIHSDYSNAPLVVTATSPQLGDTFSGVSIRGGNGDFMLKAEDSVYSCCYEKAKIDVGCRCGGEGCTFGACVNVLSSVNVKFNLGRLPGGGSCGYLILRAGAMGPDVAKPTSLICPRQRYYKDTLVSYEWPEDEMKMEVADGALKSLEVADGTVTVAVNDAYKYTLTFTPKSGDCVIVYTIENPDGASANNRLKITRNAKDKISVWEYKYTEPEGKKQWALDQGNGKRVETKRTETVAGQKQVTHTIADSEDRVAYKAIEKYQTFAWGDALVEKVVDPDNAARTNKISYYENALEAGKYSRIKLEVEPDGNWRKFDYNTNGWVTKEVSAFLDTDTNAPDSEARVILREYAPLPDDTGINPNVPRVETEIVAGATNSRTYHAFSTNTLGERTEILERAANPAEEFGSTNNLRTITTYALLDFGPEFARERTKTVEYPDGRMDKYAYEKGNWVTNGAMGDWTFESAANGSAIKMEVKRTKATGPEDVPHKTAIDVTIFDKHGATLLQESKAYGESQYRSSGKTVYALDEFGRAKQTWSINGKTSSRAWECCCGVADDVGSDGQEITYAYNDLDQVYIKTRQLGKPIVTSYLYDAAGRQIKETVSVSGGTVSPLVTTNTFDVAGQLRQTKDPAGLITTFDYEDGGRKQTVVRPGGLTNVTETYKDGKTRSVTLNGVVQEYREYGMIYNSASWTKVYTGPAGTNSPMWTKTTTDILGRTIREERPGFGGSVITNSYSYNPKGQLIKTQVSGVDPQPAATLYEYDDFGNQIRSGLDVDGDGMLTAGGADRITETELYYETDESSNLWQVTASKVYATAGSAVPTTNGIQKTRLSGFAAGVSEETVSIDMYGNATVSKTVLNPAAHLVTRTVTYPDSTNQAVTVSSNGVVITTVTKTGLRFDYGYDDFQRQTAVADPRTGTSVTHFNDKGQVDWVEDAASNRTDFAYEESTGRRVSTTDALTNTTYTAYSAEGQVIGTWGATYPVFYEFDDFNRMAAMYTLRDTNVVVTNYSSFASQPSAFDKTTWLYDLATGLLTNKLYADTNGVSYTYTGDGKLATRAWARGIVTTYRYEPNSGAMTNIDYSDSTPDVYFTLDRIGRQKTILDGQGMRSFTYNDFLQLAAETNVLGLMTRNYDSQGRNSGFTFGAGYSVGYGFDGVGRFSSVTSQVSGLSLQPFVYSYLPNSDLLSGWTEAGSGVTVSRSYEPNRNLLTQAKTMAGTNLISQFDYSNDPLGRRTQRIDGRANPPGEPSVTNLFGYNPRSELINALMGTNGFGYSYDPIGNRLSASNNAEVLTYLANALNQYTNIADGVTNVPTYDLDGNMLTCGAWTFGWDGENRLISASNGSTVVTCAYDYMGRRYQKVVNGVTNTFVYDGWAMIQESSSAGSINAYVYGLDLSGSLQGAGTIGGILVARLSGTNAFYAYDGNGNVADLTATNGTVVAHYEYDPYGNTLVKTGALADANPFRFSTKYTDDSTGLLYYGQRFYSPELGRWTSQEPIGELGFACAAKAIWRSSWLGRKQVNARDVYRFVENNPQSSVDLFGLATIPPAPAGLAFGGGFIVGETAYWLYSTFLDTYDEDEYEFDPPDGGKGTVITIHKDCTIVVLAGHGKPKPKYRDQALALPIGSSVPDDWMIPHLFMFEGTCNAGGFVGCGARSSNSLIHKTNRIPGLEELPNLILAYGSTDAVAAMSIQGSGGESDEAIKKVNLTYWLDVAGKGARSLAETWCTTAPCCSRCKKVNVYFERLGSDVHGFLSNDFGLPSSFTVDCKALRAQKNK